LGGFSVPEGLIPHFEKHKVLDDVCDIVQMNWNLMVRFHQF
jgi:hypothetical protein